MRGTIIVITTLAALLPNAAAFGHASYVGYSGAPGSRGRCASSCHGNSGGTIQISGFPTEYLPGQTYTVSISHIGGSSIRQFNGSCRIGGGSENAGTISAGANTVTYSTTGETNGIRLSSTNQENGTFEWTAPPEGVGEVRLYVAGLQGSYGGQNSTIQLTSSEQTTGVYSNDDPGVASPILFLGNYPNPFNAFTIIRFDLPSATEVEIDIVDILGRQVSNMEFGELSAGSHQVCFDATGMATGAYFYRITAAGHIETKTMLLLK